MPSYDDDGEEMLVSPTLQLECYEDDLSPAQLAAYEKAEKEHNEIRSKLDDVVKDSENIFSGDIFKAYHISGDASSALDKISKPIAELKREARKAQRVFSPPSPVTSYAAQSSNRGAGGREAMKKRSYTELDADDYEDDDYMPLAKRLARNKTTLKSIKKERSPPPPSPTPVPHKTVGRKPLNKSGTSADAAKNAPKILPNVRPSENTAVGGLSIGNDAKKTKDAPSSSVVDLTSEESTSGGKAVADSREISFNKIQGKTFPSLVVVARPCLRLKDNTSNDRTTLDAKVKSVLMHTPTKFTEWLIQQGLVRSEQPCPNHPATNSKLGMYSDAAKFPYSGGYVWISPCCQQRFVSVFNGSVFEGASQPPSVILKLIYHWSCQTNVQNVVQWVKVENLFVKGLYTWLRGVCTVALHQHMALFGGPGKKIEVGVISLGTTTQDGQQRQVKVEVLGILDPEAKLVRLRAVEPLNDGERNYKKRFAKILEPLTRWVHKDSIILTDLTVDKGTLNTMGYKIVHQASTPNDAQNRNSNSHIMDYLRRIVPRMFQNTLSLLSRQIIQQFLDELVWRECYGVSPGQAFDNIVQHLAEQTRHEDEENLITRLNYVAANPFKNWAHLGMEPNASPSTSSGAGKKKRKQNIREPSPVPIIEAQRFDKKNLGAKPKPLIGRPPKYIKKEDIPLQKRKAPPPLSTKDLKKVETIILEKLYYGTYEDTSEPAPNDDADLFAQCCDCNETFTKNTEMLDHLLKHANPSDDETCFQCRYCLENWISEEALQKHVQLTHPLTTKNEISSTFNCIICEQRFSTVPMLGTHMQKTHVPLEMPYNCAVCKFKSSSHHKTVDHFYDKHCNSNILQCPYCLKGTTLISNNKFLLENVKIFLNHLRKHANKAQNNKCTRCSLSFLHAGALKTHQIYYHTNHNDCKTLVEPVTMELSKIPRPKRIAQSYSSKDVNNYKLLEPFSNIILEIDDGLFCLECDGNMEDEKHYQGQLQCLKCPYQTCCLPTMLGHTASCTGTYETENSTLSQLDVEMHCLCGFSSSDGNALARHLAMCERRSAYPSLESVQENTVKRNMLDMLGLVPREYEDQPDIDTKLPDTLLNDEQIETMEVNNESLDGEGGGDMPDLNAEMDQSEEGGARDYDKPLEEPYTPFTPSQFDLVHDIK